MEIIKELCINPASYDSALIRGAINLLKERYGDVLYKGTAHVFDAVTRKNGNLSDDGKDILARLRVFVFLGIFAFEKEVSLLLLQIEKEYDGEINTHAETKDKHAAMKHLRRFVYAVFMDIFKNWMSTEHIICKVNELFFLIASGEWIKEGTHATL